ncbi:MAG: hypothetical protein J6Y20_11420 [Lachnospiraceae bacterium]|nr:hypothetical protein [Lachnospiraceae bacterium]
MSAFNVFEKHEMAWGADLCTKSAEELQPLVDAAVGFRSKSKPMRVSLLREYVKWCLKNGVPGACDGMLQVQISSIDKMKHQTVTSPLHLQVYLNKICDPENEETTDNIYRCFYWLAYSGVEEEEILKVKVSEIDFSSLVVRHNGEEFPIYRESLAAFRNCVNLTQFLYKHPNYSSDKIVYKERAPGDTVVRGIKNAPLLQTVRVELSRKSKRAIESGKTDLKLSYFRVWLSGLFFKTYERELAGFPVNFLDAAERFMDGKEYNLESGRNTRSAYQRRVARDYLKDYEIWKMTFA